MQLKGFPFQFNDVGGLVASEGIFLEIFPEAKLEFIEFFFIVQLDFAFTVKSRTNRKSKLANSMYMMKETI